MNLIIWRYLNVSSCWVSLKKLIHVLNVNFNIWRYGNDHLCWKVSRWRLPPIMARTSILIIVGKNFVHFEQDWSSLSLVNERKVLRTGLTSLSIFPKSYPSKGSLKISNIKFSSKNTHYAFSLVAPLLEVWKKTISFNDLECSRFESYNGTRCFLIVDAWIYNIEQYRSFTQLRSPYVAINNYIKVYFASSYLSRYAAVWLYNWVSSPNRAVTREAFKNSLTAPFIAAEDKQIARHKLRKLKQTAFVEKYLSEYRNMILMTVIINISDKLELFEDGLK